MSSFFTSKMRKVQEALGTATVTEDPPHVKEVKQHLRTLKNDTAKINRHSKQLSESHQRTSQAESKLGVSMINYSQEYSKSPLGEALLRTGEVQQSISSLENSFAHQISELLICYTKKVLEDDLKKASDIRLKQEEARVAFDIQLGKRRELRNKAGDPKYQPKIDEVDEAINTAQTVYEGLGDQLVAHLNQFDQTSSEEIICTLKRFCAAQLEFYSNAAALMQQLIPQLDSIEQINRSFIKQMLEETKVLQQQQQQQHSDDPIPSYSDYETPGYVPAAQSDSVPVSYSKPVNLEKPPVPHSDQTDSEFADYHSPFADAKPLPSHPTEQNMYPQL